MCQITRAFGFKHRCVWCNVLSSQISLLTGSSGMRMNVVRGTTTSHAAKGSVVTVQWFVELKHLTLRVTRLKRNKQKTTHLPVFTSVGPHHCDRTWALWPPRYARSSSRRSAARTAITARRQLEPSVKSLTNHRTTDVRRYGYMKHT